MFVHIPTGHPWDDGRWAAYILLSAGFECWFVGGCVRDLLLGRMVHDVDVATNAHPEQIEKLFSRVLEVGRSFGVMIAVTEAGHHVEIATFRSDSAYIDGRHPKNISYTTVKEDVQRRDFTINGILLSPQSGEIVDYVGGVQDIQTRQLRLIGTPLDRLQEDRLRVLRGIRFSALLEFTCTSETWSAMCAVSLQGLSRERIWQEWDKALSMEGRCRWIHLLCESHHLQEMCPLLDETSSAFRMAVMQLSRMSPQYTPHEHKILSEMIIFATVTVHDLWPWLSANPLPRERIQRLRWVREGADMLVAGTTIPNRRRLFQHHEAHLLVRYLNLREEVPQSTEWLAREQQEGPFKPLLRAGDLLAAGIRPGPEIGRLLRLAEDAQLCGEVHDRATALSVALEAS